MDVIRPTAVVLFFIFLRAVLLGECAPDYRSDKKSGLLISDFVITGTTSLDSTALAAIRNQLAGSCVDEDSDEITERIQALFQNRGYFAAAVTNLRVKPTDPIAIPKPASVEAEVAEGVRYRLAGIEFIGNHGVSTQALREGFPMKRGDVFARDKVASGIMNLRKLYGRSGFLDFSAEPDTDALSNATVRLVITVNERTQYHMGELKIFAKKETADRLYAGWKLPEGAVFDATYLDEYIDVNRSLLPSAFSRSDIVLVQDCPNAAIEVRLIADQSSLASQSQPRNIPCQ